MICPACNADSPSSARFCLNCGGPLTARCERCVAALPAAARFCPACGQAVAQAENLHPSDTASAGQRKLVTVLFADLVGFTAFAHDRDPEEVRDHIQPLLARFDAVIAAHGGRTEKH